MSRYHHGNQVMERSSCGAARRVVRVRFHGEQENFGGGKPLRLFNVVDADHELAHSTVTLESLAAQGYEVEFEPAAEPSELVLAFAVVRDRLDEALVLEQRFGAAAETVESFAEVAKAAELLARVARVAFLDKTAGEAGVVENAKQKF